jgi:hypothetical protein
VSKLEIEKTKGRESMADSISVQNLGLRRKTIVGGLQTRQRPSTARELTNIYKVHAVASLSTVVE